MTVPIIKCFTSNSKVGPYDFFILNKGLNSGKPMNNSCPNCFIVHCNNLEVKEHFYLISFGLWKSKCFEHKLYGSVIPFIRKGDVVTEFKRVSILLQNKLDEYQKLVVLFHSFSKHQKEMEKLLNLQKQLIQYKFIQMLKA